MKRKIFLEAGKEAVIDGAEGNRLSSSGVG